MKKIIAFFAAAVAVLSLAGCADNSESKPDSGSNSAPISDSKKGDEPQSVPENKSVALKDIEAAVSKALGAGYYCTEDLTDDEIPLSCIGSLDLSQVEEYTVKQTTVPSVQQDVFAAVKCKPGYSDEAVKGFNEHFAQMISYTRQYPFEVAKVEGARLFKIDDTVIFILAGASSETEISAEDAAKLAASEYKKIDDAVKELFGTLPENLAVIPEDTGNEGGLMTDEPLDGWSPIVG